MWATLIIVSILALFFGATFVSVRMQERKFVPTPYYWFEVLSCEWKAFIVIRGEMEEKTNATCRLEVARSDLKKLMKEGLVESAGIRPPGFDYVIGSYRLTQAGRLRMLQKPFFWRT